MWNAGLSLAGGAAVLLLLVRAAPAAPNVLLIVTDDQRWDTTGVEHSIDGTTPVMPAVEALAAEGLRYTNAFVTDPVCGPSRASLLTGQYPHRTGVHGNQPPDNALVFDDTSTLATWLQAAGYRTGFYGGYIMGYNQLYTIADPYIPPGWDEWHARRGGFYYDFVLVESTPTGPTIKGYGSGCPSYTACPGDQGGCPSPTNYQTDVLRDKVLDFLDTQPSATPFFVVFAPLSPHLTSNWAVPSCAAPEDAGSFAGLPPYRPPSFDAHSEPDPPAYVTDACPMDPWDITHADVVRRGQLEMLQSVDRAIAAFVAKLEAMGVKDDTLIIFTSDNGMRWGERCITNKYCPYEECVRTPLVVRYPPLGTGIDASLVSQADLAPTIAALAGAPVPLEHGFDGVPLGGPPREDLLVEQWQEANPPTYVMVRTDSWKYVVYDTGETELFDLAADPHELVNESQNPAHLTVKRTLARRARLVGPDWMTQCKDGIDNDADGLLDAADPQCASGNAENPGGGCGLGGEGLLPAVWLLARRRGRGRGRGRRK